MARSPDLRLRLLVSSILLCASTAFSQGMKTGSYVGSGVARSISGVGFSPTVVLIKGDLAAEPVARTSTMGVGESKAFVASSVATNQITSLDSDGFSLGTSNRVNQSGITYYWAAFGASTGNAISGSYTGNGTAQTISGLGFQPEVLMLFPEGAFDPSWKIPAMGTVTSLFTWSSSAGQYNNGVSSFTSDGFQVSSDARANSAGQIYHYMAFRAVSGAIASGAYISDGTDNRAISDSENGSGPTFQPEYVWTECDLSSGSTVHRPAAALGDTSSGLDVSTYSANGIQALLSTGFQVGSASNVNGLSGSFPASCWWVAWLGSGGTIDTIPPSAPGKPQASPVPSNGPLTLSWTAATDTGGSGIQNYDLEVAVNGGGFALLQATTSLTYSYSAAQGSYTYRVRARDNAGNLGPYSAISDTVLVDATPPTGTSTNGTQGELRVLRLSCGFSQGPTPALLLSLLVLLRKRGRAREPARKL